MPRTLKGGDGKRHPLNMRTTQEMRAKLEAAAAKSGRSLAQEVEYRLDQSFLEDAIIARVFGGPEVHEIIRLAVAAFYHEGAMEAHRNGHPEWSSSDWIKDPHCYMAAANAVYSALGSLAPAGVNLGGNFSTSYSFTPSKEPDQ